jgi:hypothetical protein
LDLAFFGLVAGAKGAEGDLGGVEELGGFGGGEDLEDDAVGDTGDEGVDGAGGGSQERYGAAVGKVDARQGMRAEDGAFGAGGGKGAGIGVETALDGFGDCHVEFLSSDQVVSRPSRAWTGHPTTVG